LSPSRAISSARESGRSRQSTANSPNADPLEIAKNSAPGIFFEWN
jgi:hypothetical protein